MLFFQDTKWKFKEQSNFDELSFTVIFQNTSVPVLDIGLRDCGGGCHLLTEPHFLFSQAQI